MEDHEKFWNLFAGVILGAEGDGDDGDDDSNDDDGDDDDNEDKDSSNNDDDSDDDEDKPKPVTQADLDAVKSALEKERRINKRLLREQTRTKNTKTTEEKKEVEDLATAQTREREAVARAEKLASGLLQRDINAAIEKAARDLKFLDPDDAIAGVDRSKIEADQDDEDPTDIIVDADTVITAVKALAAKKPHFIRTGTDDGEPTGSAFGGRKKKDKTSAETLKDLYPSLN